MEAGKRTINDLFNGNRILKIPFFQRSYVWEQENWERFLRDMEYVSKENEPYFFGSVILKQEVTDSNSNHGDVRILIDGQQRLTTLNIFFKVLYLKLGRNSSFDRMFRVDNDQHSLVLKHNYHDEFAFNEVLALSSEVILDQEKNNIYALYEYFRENIDVEKLDDQAIKNNIMFVGIDLGKDDDEQQIFDSINSLGVRLTTAELLKNYFFNHEGDVDSFQSYWKDVFDLEERRKFWETDLTSGRVHRTVIDVFFHSLLQIKIKGSDLKVRADDQSQFTRVDKLFNSYKELICRYDLRKENLLDDIKHNANLFYQSFDIDIANKVILSDDSLGRINLIIFGLGNATMIPYVLYILGSVDNMKQKDDLLCALESFIMRRVVAKTSSMGLNNFFSGNLIKNKIKTKEQFLQYVSDSDPYLRIPTDEELMNGFHHSKLTNVRAKAVLYLLESKVRNNTYQATQLLSFSKYSIEHILPKKWEKNWKFNKDYNKGEIDRALLTLGNLTIIPQSLNASIKEANWKTKRDGRAGYAGLKSYASGLELLLPYLSLDEWNEKRIYERALDLYKKAVKVWAL